MDYRNHCIDRSLYSWHLRCPRGRQPTVRRAPKTVRGGVAGFETLPKPERTKKIVETNEVCHQRSRPTHSQRASARRFKPRQHSPTTHVSTISILGFSDPNCRAFARFRQARQTTPILDPDPIPINYASQLGIASHVPLAPCRAQPDNWNQEVGNGERNTPTVQGTPGIQQTSP